MGDYQRLQTDAEAEIVPHIEPKVPLPLFHRIICAASIMFTIAAVVIFIWGLPCDLDTCESPQHSISWDKTLYDLELKGRMHLVGGHLVCILRAALWGKHHSGGFQPHTGGVIALSASTGDTVWYVPLQITPIHIDCTLLGSRRCLILGDKGFLMAIDYISGMHVWKIRSQNTSIWPQPEEIDFPLTVPGRGELITLSRFKTGGHRLLFVSMDTGVINSEPLVDSECYQVYNLTYSINEEKLHYTCSTKLGGARIMEYKLPESKNKRVHDIREPIDYGRRLRDDIVHGEEQVVVTNTGSCPRLSNATIVVTNSTNATIWTYSASRTYTLAPLPLRFRPHITGFLIKLWEWHDQPVKPSNGISVELIRERIVLITFNKTGSMHVVNASQTNIMQLCLGENECQPQLSFQTQSALLADVNGDGQQDLISYFVTYKPLNEEDHNPDPDNWELQSKVRVVRLEAELPKLYDSVSKH